MLESFPQEKVDQIFALITGALDSATESTLRAELKDKNSETSRLVCAIREVARTKIDISKIPGLEEIARIEGRHEEQNKERNRGDAV